VRNGNRWRVVAVDVKTNRVAAERLDDKARVVFDGDYIRDHLSLVTPSLRIPPKGPPPTLATPSSTAAPATICSTLQ